MKIILSRAYQLTVGLIALLAALGGTILYIQDNREDDRYQACLARFQETTNIRAQIVSDAADIERQALRDFIDALSLFFADPALFKDPRSRVEQERIRQRLEFWILKTDEFKFAFGKGDDVRTAHPIPPPPSVICGRENG